MDPQEISQKLEYLLTEVSKILPDFKYLSQGLSLSDPSFKYFSILLSGIKQSVLTEIQEDLLPSFHESILKNITKITDPISSEIRKVSDSLEQYKSLQKFKVREIDDSIEGIKGKIENLVIDKNNHASSIDTINDALENIKEDILYRPIYPEFNALVSVVEMKASHLELNETDGKLRAEIATHVKTSKFEELETIVNEINEYSKQLSTIQTMQEHLEKLKSYTDCELAKYLLSEDFRFYKGDMKAEVAMIYQKMDRQESIQGYTNDAFRKEFAALDKAVKKRPWKKDIEIFRMNLQEAAKIIELQKHKESITENLHDFKGLLEDFKLKCSNYEKVLERFDEVLLDKAAKDDVSEIKKIIQLLAKIEEVELFQGVVSNDFREVNSKLEASLEKFSKFEVIISQVNAAFRNFKSENKDSIQMKNSIADLMSMMDSKAEKVDLMAISENIAKREEINNMRSNLDVMHRQLELGVVIMQSAFRTLVKSADSAVTKNKQRMEVLKNTNILINWVGSFSSVELGSNLSSLQSGIFQKSCQNLDSTSLLPSIKHQRKSSNPDSQVFNSFELPKFKGKYDI